MTTLAVAFFWTPREAEAAVTVDTSTYSVGLAKATSFSQERKTWYDGDRYWVAFYATNVVIEFWYCDDGDDCQQAANWHENTSATITLGLGAFMGFSIEADSSNAFIAYASGAPSYRANVYAHRANTAGYPGTAFAWEAQQTVITAASPTGYNYPVIERDTNNKVRVMANLVHDTTSDSQWESKLHNNANDVSTASWGSL